MDVIDQIKNLLNEAVKWLQILGTPAAALAFGIGGFFQIFGENEGGRKARPWYIGAGIGLIIILGASAIASFLQSKITF